MPRCPGPLSLSRTLLATRATRHTRSVFSLSRSGPLRALQCQAQCSYLGHSLPSSYKCCPCQSVCWQRRVGYFMKGQQNYLIDDVEKDRWGRAGVTNKLAINEANQVGAMFVESTCKWGRILGAGPSCLGSQARDHLTYFHSAPFTQGTLALGGCLRVGDVLPTRTEMREQNLLASDLFSSDENHNDSSPEGCFIFRGSSHHNNITNALLCLFASAWYLVGGGKGKSRSFRLERCTAGKVFALHTADSGSVTNIPLSALSTPKCRSRSYA